MDPDIIFLFGVTWFLQGIVIRTQLKCPFCKKTAEKVITGDNLD